MKTPMRLLKVCLLLPLAFLVINCNRSSDNNNQNGTVSTAGYRMVGNTCYSNNGQTPVASTYCSQYNNGYGTAGGYGTTGQMINGYCYVNGQRMLDNSYCSGTMGNTGGYGAPISQSCLGTYTDTNGTQGTCDASGNCRGYLMYTYPGHQPVQCM
ncbi:MAG: hypothetical protein COT73_05275 [Bdellovibrio sp. CG10_big_fil_rev_8_21_14_0_10_47_8]|nr:MAG: hypothetical protein COT73_05275 [Bdellovibrio sp. CG10_big_fil_rev_8_21_14_0_10_47_8]